MSKNQHGLAPIIIILIVIALLAGGNLAWQYFGATKKEEVKTSEVKTSEAAAITITSPVKGEKWMIGEIYQIRWIPSDSAKKVGIILRDTKIPTASLSKVWQMENIPNTGNYSFTVPEVSPGNAYQIYISSEEKYGYSELFSIISK